MNKEKIMELLKNKKVQLIGTLALCGVIAIGTSLFMLNGDKVSINAKATSKIEEKVDENKEVKEAEKELEELKNKDTSNLSNEEKKELEDKIAEAEEKVNKAVEVASNSSSEKSNSDSVSENTSSGRSSTENNSSQTSQGGNFSSSSSEVSNPVEKPSEPVKKHTHTWVDITEEVVHPEEGHWEEVVITPEQVKEVPVYERVARDICNGCGLDITENPVAHIKEQA